jgi:hypothetical protein
MRLMQNAHSPARYAVSLVLIGAVIDALSTYPLGSAVPASVLFLYAVLLWRIPSAFLVVMPFAIPVMDLGLWTGWTLVEESDLFMLTTLAVLLIRTPPAWRDIWPTGAAGWIVVAFAVLWCIAIVQGLCSAFGLTQSSNIFLQPENALRVGKSLPEALALCPFMRARQRRHGDALPLFAIGLAAGLLGVTILVAAERLLFADVLDFSGAYRVAGPFSSMRVGGGHIGAYTALVLPFSLCLGAVRRGWTGAAALLIVLVCGTYTLAATLARTAYAAGAVGIGVTGIAWLRGARTRPGNAVARTLPILLVCAALAGIAGFTGMRARFADTGTDFTTREGNWRTGLAVRDRSILGTIAGTGLGTYQRIMFKRSGVNRPSNLALRPDGAETAVVMSINTPFYLGQKIGVDGAPVRIRLQVRAIGAPDGVTVSLCDKVLLYSDQCRSTGLTLAHPGVWQSMDATLQTKDLGRSALFGLLHRPVELSVFGAPGQIEVKDLSVMNDAGQPVLDNAGFTRGLDHWLITDDSHVSWRILNVYLMLFFEMGLFGVAAYLALSGAAIMAALNGGTDYDAAIAGSVAAFLVSGLFDNVLEAPRVATLFFLIAGSAFLGRQDTSDSPSP